jgi:hypothetical protein
LGSRDISNGQEAVEKLKAAGWTNVEVTQMDVSNDESVKTARIEIGKKTTVLQQPFLQTSVHCGKTVNNLLLQNLEELLDDYFNNDKSFERLPKR